MVSAAPYTFVRTIAFHSSGVADLKPRAPPKPAFAKATSIRPYASSARAKRACWSSHSVTSQRTAMARSSPPSSSASAVELVLRARGEHEPEAGLARRGVPWRRRCRSRRR